MRRIRTLTLTVATLLAGLSLSVPAHAAFFLGDTVDGPSADIASLGDVDLARDGTGAIVYVKAVGGVDHVFVARFEGGIVQPPVQIDGGLAGISSQPVVGASDGGRLAIAFVNAGTVYGVVRPAGGGFLAPVALGPGVDPSVDLSINGTAYASFTSAGDVRIARLDRQTNAWTTLSQPADVDPSRPAGVGSGRSRVSISADGIGIVTWGEAGHVFARKMFNTGLSDAPQDLTPATFDGRVSTVSDLPDVDTEDDSSYAWVVFRQSFADGGSRILARRQRGTAFDPPVAVDAGDEPATDPRIDLNGRGIGVATMSGATSLQPMVAQIDVHNVFGPGGRILGPSLVGPAAVPAVSENNSALVATVLGGTGDPAVIVQPYTDGKPGLSGTLSRPELGPVDPDLGFDAAADRAGGVLVAWVQGPPGSRRLVAGYDDREPGGFLGYTAQACCRTATPKLSWQPAFNLWGAVRYEVLVDGAVVGTPTATTFQTTVPLANGTHTWQVRATDIRGQATRSKTRLLRIDARKPLLSVGYKRKKRVVTLGVHARDDARAIKTTSGMKSLVVSWGDRTPGARGVTSIRTTHRYRRPGSYPLTITARDKAGNATVSTRTVRVG
ncbi:MAG TPA: PKD domain-containing protein [Solirubrobacteraceae bacterium]|nr:PKD domain-containing protein [Solirubrobacteraceae bacterium]